MQRSRILQIVMALLLAYHIYMFLSLSVNPEYLLLCGLWTGGYILSVITVARVLGITPSALSSASERPPQKSGSLPPVDAIVGIWRERTTHPMTQGYVLETYRKSGEPFEYATLLLQHGEFFYKKKNYRLGEVVALFNFRKKHFSPGPGYIEYTGCALEKTGYSNPGYVNLRMHLNAINDRGYVGMGLFFREDRIH
jgi:hypothetical protein